MFDIYEVENMILGMAEIVYENRRLRRENEKLRETREEYYKFVSEAAQASERASHNMLKAAITGIAMGKSEIELAQELVEHI